jgi:biphenyl-2,3-diol 1,2-dioxygenase
MTHEMKLGYLVFEARAPEKWRTFCSTMLGLPEPVTNTDGSDGYRLDDAMQRLVVRSGDADDLAAIGLELPTEDALSALARRVSAAGVAVEEGDGDLLRARHVQRLVRFRDPAGNWIEAFVGLAATAEQLASEHFPGGFDTDLGIGHVALLHHDLEEMERFYVDVLGHGVSERMASRSGPLPIGGVFLHCNRRHHTIAILDLPLDKRVHHFMLEAVRRSAVGRAFERATSLGVPLSLGLGEHSDGTFSFYAATPSGFDFEIGAGGEPIDPGTWQAVESSDDRVWGHQPTLRLKLKTVAALIKRRLVPKRRADVLAA